MNVGEFHRELAISEYAYTSDVTSMMQESAYPRTTSMDMFSTGGRYAMSKCIKEHGFDSLVRCDKLLYFTNSEIMFYYLLHVS